MYSKKLEKGVSHSVSEDSLDILFRKGYRELEEKMLRRVPSSWREVNIFCGSRCRKISVWINMCYMGRCNMGVIQCSQCGLRKSNAPLVRGYLQAKDDGPYQRCCDSKLLVVATG